MTEKLNDCVITNTLKARFCKDRNIPIKIFDEPYFANFLDLYDEHYDAKKYYQQFVELVNELGGEQFYFEAYNKLKDDAIEYLKNNEKMTYFSEVEDMNKFAIKNVGYPSNDIFKETNDGCYFVSVDMIKGNFTSLHHYSPEIVGNCDTYEDFIGMFTDYEYFKSSKYIRQVIFGNRNPRRQVTYEKYLMDCVLSEVLKKLHNFGVILEEEFKDYVAFFSTDEFVIKVPQKYIKESGEIDETFCKVFEECVEEAKKNNINVRAEFFKLEKIKGTDGYVKKFRHNKSGLDFKCLDFLTMSFVFRKMKGQKVNVLDKTFLYEGRKVQLIEDIDVEL